MTLWGKPGRVHMQNMEQLHAYDDCHQNQATEYHNKCTHMYMNCESGLAIIYKVCCTQAGPAHAAGGDGMDR